LWRGWAPGAYLALILVWALPPIMLQLAVGADILWRYRRLVLTALLTATAYLGAADSLAINAGIWTISPAQSFGVFLGGRLPLEEAVFFLVTNTLIVFGVTLLLARETRQRLADLLHILKRSEIVQGQA
jgi:lycopene cyclase domain-containing protein